jgi:hypothetical protein
MKNFNPLDLPTREVNYAEQYKLNPKQYCQIKDKVWEEAATELRVEIMKKAKTDARTELREEIKKEIYPGLIEAAEKKAMPDALKKAEEIVLPKMKQAAYEKYREEWEAEKPNESDKEAFLAATREIEIDCLTFAMSASHEADTAWDTSGAQTLGKKGGIVAAFLGAGPYLLWLINSFSFSTWTPWLLMLPYIVGVISLFVWDPKETNATGELRKMASMYLKLVGKARMLRLLTLETQNRETIRRDLMYIIEEKSRLDEKYRPSLKLMEEIKPSVKLRLTDEMDPEKLFAEEFDERLIAEAKKV